MSSYYKTTKHPVTDKWERANWIDDCFGPHKYGVEFSDGNIYNPEEMELETREDVEPQKCDECQFEEEHSQACSKYVEDDMEPEKNKIKEEGDRYEFEAFGMKCLMLRHERFLHWCGYVAVPADSILARKPKSHYYTESELGLSDFEQDINNISVHGGITYIGKRNKDNDLYWGFDCGHLGDKSPGIDRIEKHLGISPTEWDVYRDKEYVIEECKNLAKQLLKIIKIYENNSR